MTLTRIVAQLDYVHDGPNSVVESLVIDLFGHLSEFAAIRPGLEVVVVGFAEAHDEDDAPYDGIEELASRRG